MQKIDKLTKKQEKQLIEHRNYWLSVGLSTEPANFDTAQAIITEFYKRINKPAPIFWKCDGILQAQLWMNLFDINESSSDFRNNLRSNLQSNVGSNLRSNFQNNLWSNLGSNLQSNLRSNLWDNLRSNLRSNFQNNLWSNLGSNLVSNLRSNLESNLESNLHAGFRNFTYRITDFYGSLDVYWIAYYLYPELYIKPMYANDDKVLLNLWANLSAACFWWWPFENVCFISDRPSLIKIDDINRLHCDNGPAISFRDGWKLYYWHGVNVPEWIIETPEKITPESIQEEKNAEIKRVMYHYYGWERLLTTMKAKLIDKHNDPRIGELWRWCESDGVNIQILRVLNGTPDPETGKEKWYTIRVPLNFNRAIDANRNSYPIARNMTDEEFIIWNNSRT